MAMLWVVKIPFLYPTLFFMLGTYNIHIDTNIEEKAPSKEKVSESTWKLWKKKRLINGIASPAPIDIIKVGLIALKILLQLWLCLLFT